MEACRIDRVRIDALREVVEITWVERDWLLKKIAGVGGYQTIVAKLYRVEASGPVEFDFGEHRRLRSSLEREHDLPDGLARLLNALELPVPGGHVAIGSIDG